ncbi:SCA7-domain-containing protein, partial [Hyphopichia burtonii NRRL Y-1933]
NATSKSQRPIIWKDFGVYLDKKLDYQLDSDFIKSSSTSSHLISNHTPDSSYLSQVIKYKICTSCNRPIGEESLSTHYPRCIEMKQKKQQQPQNLSEADTNGVASNNKRKRGRGANPLLDLDPSSVDSSRNSSPIPNSAASKSDTTTKPKKKYKKSQTQKDKEAANAAAAAAAAALRNNSKKKQMKAKGQVKPKGPVDVEKQCGVPLPAGGFCARSLTCKTHSMGAKRAVLGRSAPYDVLLQQYQKRNQAKLAANNVLAAQRRENAHFNGGGQDDQDGNAINAHKILDPDEETHLVLEGLSKNYPIPLERKIMVPAKNRHKFLYMREAYANALITSGGNSQNSPGNQSTDQTLANQAISGSIGGLQGRCALVNVDTSNNDTNDPSSQAFAAIPGELYQVRAPSKAILMSAQYNAQQQQAFQQQVMKMQQQQQQQQ